MSGLSEHQATSPPRDVPLPTALAEINQLPLGLGKIEWKRWEPLKNGTTDDVGTNIWRVEIPEDVRYADGVFFPEEGHMLKENKWGVTFNEDTAAAAFEQNWEVQGARIDTADVLKLEVGGVVVSDEYQRHYKKFAHLFGVWVSTNPKAYESDPKAKYYSTGNLFRCFASVEAKEGSTLAAWMDTIKKVNEDSEEAVKQLWQGIGDIIKNPRLTSIVEIAFETAATETAATETVATEIAATETAERETPSVTSTGSVESDDKRVMAPGLNVLNYSRMGRYEDP